MEWYLILFSIRIQSLQEWWLDNYSKRLSNEFVSKCAILLMLLFFKILVLNWLKNLWKNIRFKTKDINIYITETLEKELNRKYSFVPHFTTDCKNSSLLLSMLLMMAKLIKSRGNRSIIANLPEDNDWEKWKKILCSHPTPRQYWEKKFMIVVMDLISCVVKNVVLRLNLTPHNNIKHIIAQNVKMILI